MTGTTDAAMRAAPRVVAHRGYRGRYPENSLPALSAALEAGAWGVEFDVQLSADARPLLLHDTGLERTTGVDASVHDSYAATLARIPLIGGRRPGARPLHARIPTLDSAVNLLQDWPRAHVLAEIKQASVQRFGARHVLNAVLPPLRRLGERWSLIAFDRSLLEAARAYGVERVGWIMRRYDDDARRVAEAMRPALLICRDTRLPRPWPRLWSGPWEWAIYEVNDPDRALTLANRGADIIETAEVEALLAHPAWHADADLHGG